MSRSAHLTLVPTPIHESLPLEPVAQALLLSECLLSDVIILVEDHKVARTRWLAWGLPRDAIARFELLNEHTQKDKTAALIQSMKRGIRYYVFSDSGLPAFCDPGQALVNACHEAKLKVTCTPFPNSVALALALSGFVHERFYFAGFLPANVDERKRDLERLAKTTDTLILMDTPYRMSALLRDVATSALKKRSCFLAVNLNKPEEQLLRGDSAKLAGQAEKMGKQEFVLVINQA